MVATPRPKVPASSPTSRRGSAPSDLPQRTRRSANQLKSIVDSMPGFIFRRVQGPDGSVTYPYVSPNFHEWCGVAANSKARPATSVHDYIHPDDRQRYLDAMALSANEMTPVEIDVRLDTAENAVRWVRTVSYPHELQNGDIQWDGIALDVTKAKALETHLAHHDLLTGLPNRTLFVDWFGHVLERPRHTQSPAIVIALELASLADIRENSGFDAGDASICETCARLQGSIQGGDTVAYIGGGGFLMVLMGKRKEKDFTAPIRSIMRQFERRFELEGQDYPLDVLMGISVAPADGNDAETLIRNATTALNKVKDAPERPYQFYDAQMTESAVQRLGIESDLRRAIDRNELILFFQPQYSTQTLEIVGIEALIRWQHPEHGLIPPDDFIPIAEESGLIAPIGEFALRQACTQVRDWQCRNVLDVPIAVNLSAWQLVEKDLGDRILAILEETGLAPDCLKLELTESSILRDVETVTRTMGQLADAGVRFAVDDFGIEHSALSHLSRLPIETLKIDYSFIALMTSDRVHAALVQAIIMMTHAMGMVAVAEGIETPEQFSYLRAYQCDALQGFLLSRPLPAGQLEALIKREKTKHGRASSAAARLLSATA